MKKLLLFSILTWCIGVTQVLAYRGPILKLSELYSHADRVVLAHVVERAPHQGHAYYDTVARLKVHIFLKNKEGDTNLLVLFSSRRADPMPAQFPNGQLVLAFLEKSQVEGELFYVTCGGFEGSIYKREVLEATLPRVKELGKLLPLLNEPEQLRSYTDWLMRCVRNEYTRGDALHDLIYFKQPMHEDKEAFDSKLWENLTTTQLIELKNLIQKSRLDPHAVSIFSERRDTGHMMQILANRFGDEELISLREKYLEAVPRIYLPGHNDIPYSQVIQRHQSLCKQFVGRVEQLINNESSQRKGSLTE